MTTNVYEAIKYLSLAKVLELSVWGLS